MKRQRFWGPQTERRGFKNQVKQQPGSPQAGGKSGSEGGHDCLGSREEQRKDNLTRSVHPSKSVSFGGREEEQSQNFTPL